MVTLGPQAKPRTASLPERSEGHEGRSGVEPVVAYFSCEYALDDRLPFAGGLGVLAADYLLEASKQNFPLTAVGLAYQGVEKLGFTRQENLSVAYWFKEFGSAKLYLLDGGELTRIPYGPDYQTQLRQELLLGFGGVKLLKDLGLQPAVYHLNEGHTAFVILALQKNHDRTPVVATKHTVLSQSGLHIFKKDFPKILEWYWPEKLPAWEEIYQLGSDERHPDFFSSNKFLLRFAVRSNGVSVKHCEVEKEVHPNSPLISITNGVNRERWQTIKTEVLEDRKQKIDSESGKLDNLNNQEFKNSRIQGQEFHLLSSKYSSNDVALWSAHCQNRKILVDYINENCGSRLDNQILTVVWARRLAEYKQPELIISDIERLGQLINPNGGRGGGRGAVQFVIAGAVTAADPGQQSAAERLEAAAANPALSGRFAFLPRYNLEISKILVAGADVWLNTPVVSKEACGTSTMKAGLNGALIISLPDGWIPEENWADLGWILDPNNTAADLYHKIDAEVAPLFYRRNSDSLPVGWFTRMEKTINLIASKYTTARMLADYKEKLYLL